MTQEEFEKLIRDDRNAAAAIDRRVTAALKTYRENHPAADVSEYEEKIKGLESEIERMKIETHVAAECRRLSIPEELLDELGVSFDNAENATIRLEAFAERWKKERAAATNQYIVDNAFTPGSGIAEKRFNPKTAPLNRLLFEEMAGALDEHLK